MSVDSAAVVLQSGGAGTGIAMLVFMLLLIGLVVAAIAGMWKTFTKAGEPGWASIVPVYNIYVMLRIGDNAWWWLLVILFVPLVNIYGMWKMYRGIAKAFGQGVGFTLGLFFLGPIFFAILGFGDYRYQGAPA